MKIHKIKKKIGNFFYKNKFQYNLNRIKSSFYDFSKHEINISIAMTCFNKVDYTVNAINSLLSNTVNKKNYKYKFYLLDDCSTDDTFKRFQGRKDLKYYRQNKQKGVNHLWNWAFEITKKSDFIIIINNDVLFSKNWADKLINEMILHHAVSAGPITNAPGNRPKQNVRNYLDEYKISDANDNIEFTSSLLKNKTPFTYRTLNGFCMAFNTRWISTLEHPIINSPDPNFAGEDLFFKKYPCSPLIVPSSFIFHYKQVSVSRNNFKNQQYRIRE